MTDGATELYASVPFPSGDSPFRIKGTGYIFHDRWVAEHLPGGRDAQREALGTLGDDEFFHTIFVGGAMYDVFPLVALGHACAAVRGETMEEFVRMRAAYQAELDLRHIRKLLVKIASPSAVAKRFPSILGSYFDFGTAETEVLDHAVRGHLRAVPEVLGPWMIATCLGFAGHALEVNGARDVRMNATVEPRGDAAHGLRLADLRLDFGWS